MTQHDRQNLHDRLVAVVAPSSLPAKAVAYAKRAVYTAKVDPSRKQDVKFDLERAAFFAETVRSNVLGQFLLDLSAAADERPLAA
jgi:hypothetical protein